MCGEKGFGIKGSGVENNDARNVLRRVDDGLRHCVCNTTEMSQKVGWVRAERG